MIYLKIFPRCARQFVKNFWRKSWQNNDIIYSKNFPRCARQFVKIFLYKMMKNQWYIQKISALRALICYELLRISFHDFSSEILFRKQNEMYGY